MQSVPVRRSTDNDVSGHFFPQYLFILPVSPLSTFTFLIERVFNSKTYLATVDWNTQKPMGRPLSGQPFWDCFGGRFIFCRWCNISGGEQVAADSLVFPNKGSLKKSVKSPKGGEVGQCKK